MGGGRGRLVSFNERCQAIALIKEASAAGARRQQACEILGLTIRTLERWEKDKSQGDMRQTATRMVANKLTGEQRNMVLNIANSHLYQHLPPSKIVPMLADNGQYIASESTFYRILRDAKQLTHRMISRPAQHKRPEAHTAHQPNQVWSWDISYLPTLVQGLFFYLYFIIDIYSRKIVGWSVHERENSEHAAMLIKQACLDEKVQLGQLVLHSDNGTPMKGVTQLVMLQELGVIPSFSRPSVSDDNPYSEALFRTAKYHNSFPWLDKFATIMEARIWGEKFVQWYNNEHLHSALKFVTPQQRHSGDDHAIRIKRHAVYQMAKQQNPERWSGQTRNWLVNKIPTLNPNRKINKLNKEDNTLIKLVA